MPGKEELVGFGTENPYNSVLIESTDLQFRTANDANDDTQDEERPRSNISDTLIITTNKI